VIKVVRAVTGLGLRKPRTLVDGRPNRSRKHSQEGRRGDQKQIEEAGAKAEINKACTGMQGGCDYGRRPFSA